MPTTTTTTQQTTRTFTGRFTLKAVSGGWEIRDPQGKYAPRWCATKKDARRVIDFRLAHERLAAQHATVVATTAPTDTPARARSRDELTRDQSIMLNWAVDARRRRDRLAYANAHKELAAIQREWNALDEIDAQQQQQKGAH